MTCPGCLSDEHITCAIPHDFGLLLLCRRLNWLTASFFLCCCADDSQCCHANGRPPSTSSKIDLCQGLAQRSQHLPDHVRSWLCDCDGWIVHWLQVHLLQRCPHQLQGQGPSPSHLGLKLGLDIALWAKNVTMYHQHHIKNLMEIV
jgi:hypothetical protein